MKRNAQGKFVLKDDDYRSVRSLRLTDSTWAALGAAAQSLGITRADYLEQMVRSHEPPSITPQATTSSPSITRYEEEIERFQVTIQNLRQENVLLSQQAKALPLIADIEAIRARVLFDLKLGKQASGYKAAQKALNRFIAELNLLA